jgi:hypothetical protein
MLGRSCMRLKCAAFIPRGHFRCFVLVIAAPSCRVLIEAQSFLFLVASLPIGCHEPESRFRMDPAVQAAVPEGNV